MTVRDAVLDGEDPSGGRAQSELVGVILLFGLVAIAAISLMFVAGGAISDAEAQAEQERIEQSFVELSHAMATATSNGDMPNEVEFEAGESGAITKSDAGTIHIEGGDVDETLSMGAIEYEHDDGSIVAYQAGGVWAERGMETRMVSAPPVHYDAGDQTLTLPITTMSEQRDLSSGSVGAELRSTDPVREASVVENDSIDMTIESPYYRGWKQYFETQGGDGTIRYVDHQNETVGIKFGFHEIDEALQTGATIGGQDEKYFEDHEANEPIVGDEHQQGTLMPEMDPVIYEMISDAKDGEIDELENLSAGEDETLENSTYFVEEIDGDVEYDVNLAEGDVTLLVEENVQLDGGHIRVTDRKDEHVLRVYSGGELLEVDGEVCVNDCDGDATAIQFYGPSDMAVDLGPGQGGTFEGLLYVASSEEKDWWGDLDTDPGGQCEDYHQVYEQAGAANITGSVVAYSMCAHSQGMSFDYDESLQDIDLVPYPEEYSLPPQITYLNVAIYELHVDNR